MNPTSIGVSYAVYIPYVSNSAIQLLLPVSKLAHWPLNSTRFKFYDTKRTAMLRKMLNLGFRDFKPIFLRMTFFSVATFFLKLRLSVSVDIRRD